MPKTILKQSAKEKVKLQWYREETVKVWRAIEGGEPRWIEFGWLLQTVHEQKLWKHWGYKSLRQFCFTECGRTDIWKANLAIGLARRLMMLKIPKEYAVQVEQKVSIKSLLHLARACTTDKQFMDIVDSGKTLEYIHQVRKSGEAHGHIRTYKVYGQGYSKWKQIKDFLVKEYGIKDSRMELVLILVTLTTLEQTKEQDRCNRLYELCRYHSLPLQLSSVFFGSRKD